MADKTGFLLGAMNHWAFAREQVLLSQLSEMGGSIYRTRPIDVKLDNQLAEAKADLAQALRNFLPADGMEETHDGK